MSQSNHQVPSSSKSDSDSTSNPSELDPTNNFYTANSAILTADTSSSITTSPPFNSLETNTINSSIPTPQRLSLLRQGGTASVLDLASLVRSARDRAQQSNEFIIYSHHPSNPDQPNPISFSSASNPALEPRSALVSRSSLIDPSTWSYCLSSSDTPTDSQSHQQVQVQPSQFTFDQQPSTIDLEKNLTQLLSNSGDQQTLQPRLSSSALVDHDHQQSQSVDSHPTSINTIRSSTGSRKSKPQRSKSHSTGLHALWALAPHESPPKSSIDSCPSSHSITPSLTPSLTPSRLRAFSGPSSSDPQLSSSPPVPKKLPQVSSSTMRKKSGFFRRKLSASLSQADLKGQQLPTPNSHQPLQLDLSPTPPEPLVPRHPLTNEPSNHQQDKPLYSPPPPVPLIPSSYHPSSGSQSTNPPPMPFKPRLSSTGSTRQSLARPPSAGHSQDSEDSRQDPSTSTNSKTLLNSHQDAFRKSISASQPIRHGSPSESLFSPSASSRSHSPALSSTKQQAPFPSPSSQPKSTRVHSTSRALVSQTERSDPLIPRAAQSRPPSSTNLTPSSLSKIRTIPPSFDSRLGKNRPVLSPTTFLGFNSSTLVGADGGQISSSASAGSASQHASTSLSSLLLADTPSQPHHLLNLSSTTLSEEDKLRLSLERWNLDQDGVLRGGLSSISPQTPKASASDLIENPHTQDIGIPERVFNKPLVLSPPASQQYNLTKNPPPSDSSALSASPCLPSLVNPNRTAIQSRYPTETLDKSLNLSRIKALNLDHSSPIPSSSLLPISSPALSSQHSPSSDGSTILVNPGSISSPNLSSSGLSSPIVSRASSMKETRDITFSSFSPVRANNLRRRGYTEDDRALAPKILGSQFPAASRHPSIRPQISSQPVSRTTSAETAPGSTVDHLTELAHDDGDSENDVPLSLLSPTIRLLSSSHSTPSETDDPLSVNTANSIPNGISTPPSSKTNVSSFPQSHPRSSFFNRADLSSFSKSSGHGSPTVRAPQPQPTKPAHLKRGNAGLGIKPTAEPDRSLTQHNPQLQRRDLDQTQPAKLGPASDDLRTPRNHQSSPNLRALRPPTPTDSSFFSVIVSGPGPQHPELDSRASLPAGRESLTVHSQSHSLPSSTCSPTPDHSDKPDLLSSDSRHPLHAPGMSLQANADRLAELFWQEDESIIKRRKLTEWLGSPETTENQLQVLTRRAFMDKFDFKDLRIDLAFRKLCTKMYLKGETQQVDRILAEFSRRYWEQNQSNIYINADMVHAMSYSILLLNTDLHVVDTTTRMSRSQFIRNTMETVYAQLSQFDLPEANRPKGSFTEPSRPSSTNPEPFRTNFKAGSSGSMVTRNRRTSFVDLSRVLPASATSSQSGNRPSMERWRDALRTGSQPIIRTSRRSHSITSWPSEDELQSTSGVCSPHQDGSSTHHERTTSIDTGPSCSPAANRAEDLSSAVKLDSAENGSPAPKAASKANFEKEVESLLKDIYMAVKSHPIAQNLVEPQSQESGAYGSLQRMASRRGHYPHGVADSIGPHKRASLRGFGGFAAMLTAGPDTPGGRPNSPTPSASTSVSSLPSGMMGYSSNAGSSLNLTNMTTPSIGFVSNLSQSIIREQHEEESLETSQIDDEQTRDSELALLGAPWAKEGILQRKQYWESKGKRHKDRGWAQVFVVIQTGVLKMFQFGNTGASSAAAGIGTGSAVNEGGATTTISSEGISGVGGGNWLPNAQLLGAITLSHALTSVLVSGYSKDRAHVFVLTLSNGASYFFQAGTEELVYEWVSTCNYWAARLSKEPLTGGVSNMEYGWNKLLETESPAAVDKKEELRECQGDQEEMMSIVSGHSGHSHKGRRLRDRLFNGLPLGTPHSPAMVTQNNRPSDLEHWSLSATSIDTQGTTSQPESKAASNLTLDSPPGQPAVPEKLNISEWNPPVPPMALSSLPEHVQLENLRRHNSHIQVELERHNLLRRPMVNMYWNRPIYLQKAMTNWEKKSQYLMAEIIKYTTYLNALESTIKLKLSLST